MKSLDYNGRSCELRDGYDVIVVGGGTSGAACAIRAAQLGLRTLVVEKATALGGTATAALVAPMMASQAAHYPLYHQIDARLGSFGAPTHHAHNNGLWFNPDDMARCLEELLLEAGGEVLFDATLVDADVEGGSVEHLVAFSEGRPVALAARCYVDATGDAVLSRLAGVPCASGDERGNSQCVSLRFEMGGIDVERYRSYCASIGDTFCPMTEPGEFFESAMVAGGGFALEPLFRRGVEDGVLREEDLRYYQCFTVPGKPGCMGFNRPHVAGLDKNTSPWARSRGLLVGRAMTRRLVAFLTSYMPGFEHAFLLREATMLGVRESYRIVGRYVLTERDYERRARFDDAVARGDWYIDVHGAGEGGGAERRPYEPGEYYEIPWRALVSDAADNLVTIGRCISTSFLMQASVRIQPTVIDMGWAAAEACALAREEGVAVTAIDGAALGARLAAELR